MSDQRRERALQQDQFAAAIVAGRPPAEAALAAGYSQKDPDRAPSAAARLLSRCYRVRARLWAAGRYWNGRLGDAHPDAVQSGREWLAKANVSLGIIDVDVPPVAKAEPAPRSAAVAFVEHEQQLADAWELLAAEVEGLTDVVAGLAKVERYIRTCARENAEWIKDNPDGDPDYDFEGRLPLMSAAAEKLRDARGLLYQVAMAPP